MRRGHPRVFLARTVCALFFILAASQCQDLVFAQSSTATSIGEQDPLSNPVVRGAWLYAGYCVRCHGDYAAVRFAKTSATKDVRAKITGAGRQGCEISWSIAHGGPLTSGDIDALMSYMSAWEAAGAAPALPALPALPTRLAPTPLPARAGKRVVQTPTPAPTDAPLDPQLEAALAGDPVAEGAWLYAQNCQRCHYSYATGRMRSSLEGEVVKKTIRESRPGATMPKFGFMLGGPLKSAQIDAIVTYMDAWEAQQSEPQLPEIVRDAINAEAAKAQAALDAMEPEARAKMLFGTHCATCHGLTGEGGTGPALSHPFLGMHPSATIRDVIANGSPGTEMIAWGRIQNGPLDDRSLDELAALVRGWRTAAELQAPATIQPAEKPTSLQGPWVFPIILLTVIAYGMTLLLGAIGFWKE